MNKLIVGIATIALFGVVGCGGSSAEKEYEGLCREYWSVMCKGAPDGTEKKMFEKSMVDFRKASPEIKQRLIEFVKNDLKELKERHK